MEKSLNPENGDTANVGERSRYAEFTVTEKAKTNTHEPETVLSGPGWEIYRERKYKPKL